jgi:hypothetical protein
MHSLSGLWLRRFIVALFVSTFVPVASASIACQAACAWLSSDSHLSRAVDHDTMAASQKLADHEVPRRHAADHLQHGGPCHLAAVPGAASDVVEWGRFPIVHAWRSIATRDFHSFIWPPPEHRPRA